MAKNIIMIIRGVRKYCYTEIWPHYVLRDCIGFQKHYRFLITVKSGV